MKLALAPRRHWHGLVVVAVALVVIAAIVALPAGVRLLAVRQIEQLTGREVSIANVDLNLFTRHLVVHELRVAGTHNGPPVVALARLDARFGLWALVRGRIQLMSVDVDDPLVRLRREAQGELNIEDIVARIASRPPAEEPWHFTVEQLAVHDGRIVFEDAEAEPTYSWEATDLRLELADVGTDLDQGRASLTFQVAGARAGMELTGITVRPLAARFVATLDGFEIAIMRHYIPRDAPVRITGGVLTTRTEGRYHAREGAVVSGRTTIKGATVEREESGGTFLRLPEATATAREVRWRNGVASADRLELTTSVTLLAGGADAGHEPHEIEIAPVHLVIDGVQHPASAPGRVTLTAGLPDDGTLDARGTATIEPLDADLDVSLAGLDLTLARPFLPGDAAITIGSGRASATFDIRASGARLTADGDFAIGDLRLFRRGQTQPFILDRRVSGTIDGLTLARGDVMAGTATLTGTPTIVDASRGEPQRFELRRLEARIADVTWPARDPSRVAIDAAIADGGTVSVQGLFDPSSLAANVEAEVADLDLTRFTPYVPADAPLALGRGVASARVRVTHARDAGVAIEGSAMLHDLVLLRRGQGDAFISDPSLEIAVSGLRIDDGVVRMERTTVRGAPQVIIAGADGVHHPVQFSSSDISIEDGGWPGPTTARVEAAATLVSGGRSSLQGSVDLPTLKARGRATFDDLVLSVINTFLPPDGFVRIAHGLLDATVEFTHDRTAGIVLSGDGVITDPALVRRGQDDALLTDDRLAFTVKDFVAKNDVLAVGRATLSGSPVVSHGTRQTALPSLFAAIENLRWPGDEPARVQVEARLPGNGELTADATIRPGPRTVEGRIALRDAAAGAIGDWLPIAAPLRGQIDANFDVHATLGAPPDVRVRGDVAATDLELGPQDRPAISIASLDAAEIEAQWPPAVRVGKLTVQRPSALIVRDADGSFPLRAMLAPARRADAADSNGGAASPEQPSAGPRPAPEPDDVDVRFTLDRVEVRDGDARFVDRSARPFFSEEVTQLRLTLEGVTNAEDEQRAEVEILGVVGAGAALALEGEVAPFAELFYLDLEGRLRDFNVPRTNPYLQRLFQWTASSGQLTTRVHYRIVGQHLEATNEVIVERLSVEPASESPDRLVGLPLGLVVSLLKDRRGEIRLTIPLEGRVTAPEWSFGDAMRTAFKNVITRLVTGPFRTIGRVFQRGDGKDELAVEINPIVFEPGTAALPPDAQKQIQRVADFLRASPHVRLGLSAAVSGEDRAALRAQRITARVQEIQRRLEIEDFDEAARRLYAREFPDQPPPATAEAAMPILANALPRPDPAVDRLGARRIEAIREALINVAGIELERIVARDAPVSISADEGRVQFELLPAT